MRTQMLWLLALVILCAAVSCASLEAATTCKSCGETIVGSRFETGGYFYHPHHFTCGHCNEPITEAYTTYRKSNYHNACFDRYVALRCTVCGETIQGKYILDPWGNASHMNHHGDVVRCDFCSRFITGSLSTDMVRYADGRYLCGRCSPSAVTDLHRARKLMFEVARHLRRYGVDVDPATIDLRLVTQDRLQEVSRRRTHNLTGFTDYHQRMNLLGWVRNRRINVYVLHGMPRVQMMGTLAHELTHVWQFVNGRLKQDRALSEGSCNFAAYLVLRKIPGEESEFIIQSMLADEDPVYGEGFRRVKRYAETHGLARWLELLKSADVRLSSF